MPKLRIYLDTSVISHLFHDDTPERKSVTWELFENAIDAGVYDAFISDVVLNELSRAKDPALRTELLAAAFRPALEVLPSDNAEIVRLAAVYLRQNVLPSKNPEDALHVAYATV